MKINNRLKMIGDLVQANSFCLDVGCDHALLDIYLKEEYPNINIIASDIHDGAIQMAKKNIEKSNLDGQIDLRLGDGLNVVEASEIDTIVIAGMGFHTIEEILNNKEKLKNIKKIIIQSNTDVVKLRKAVIKLGYKINKESLVEDSDIVYTIIEFVPGEEKYDYKQIYFGPRLMENKDDLFNEYYSKKLLKYENLLLQLPKQDIINRMHHAKLIKIIKEEVEIKNTEE